MNRLDLVTALRGVPYRRTRHAWERRQTEGLASIRSYQRRRLQAVVDRARELGVRALRDRLPGRLAEAEEPAEWLRDMPFLEAEDLTELVATVRSASSTSGYFFRETAGTSGVPRGTYLDREALALRLAARTWAFAGHGVTLGDREARLWGRPRGGLTSRLRERLLNREVFQFLDSDPVTLRREAERLMRFRPRYLYGYSSLLVRSAAAWRQFGLPRLPLAVIVYTAERMTGFQRHAIEASMGAPVRMEYGCTEADIISFECRHGINHVLEQNVILEVDGEEGFGEAIVTDLTNLAVPLLRYRMGDMIRLTHLACECGVTGQAILEVQGRLQEGTIPLRDGSIIHSVDVARAIEHLVAAGCPIEQFHLRQHAFGVFELHLKCRAGDVVSDEATASARRAVATALGGDVELSVKWVEHMGELGRKHAYYTRSQRFRETLADPGTAASC